MDGKSKKVAEASSSQSDTVSDFSTLPEACIVYILALTCPPDICRMRAVARWLMPAVESDALWIRFLPDDYQQIFARSAESPSLRLASKKDLFFRLCDSPLLIDDGKKMFWLEKRRGEKCYMLAARELTIIWGDTPRYWEWFSVPESRFSEIAYLKNVCWLQIKGMINGHLISLETNYAAYLVFKLSEDSYGFDHVEVKSSIKIEGEQTAIRKSYLKRRRMNRRVLLGRRELHHSSQEHIPHPTTRIDGWLEIELGEFFTTKEEDHIEVEITQLGSHWKRGLMVEGIEIRPKDNA